MQICHMSASSFCVCVCPERRSAAAAERLRRRAMVAAEAMGRAARGGPARANHGGRPRRGKLGVDELEP
eukprot:2023210-Alexandrium_andersonii.AAC.1